MTDLLARGAVVLDGGLSNALEDRGHDLSSALWTARLLRDDVGFLVTHSTARAVEPFAAPAEALSADPREDVQAGIAMLRGGGWYAKERLWLGAEVALRALGALRAGQMSVRELGLGASRGWRAVRRG